MTRRWLAALTTILVLLAPATARAQASPPPAKIQAEAFFNDARGLLDKGDVAGACDLFSKSQGLDPAVGTLLNLGSCYERLGRTASAWAAYQQAVSLANVQNQTQRAAIAKADAARLEPRLARLTIVVESPPPGLAVTRNGEVVDANVLDRAVPVDAGPQRVHASAPEHEPWDGTVNASDGAEATIKVPRLVKLEPAKPPPPPEKRTSYLPLGLEIGGGALLAGGLVFGGLSFSKWSDVEDRCPGATCASEDIRRDTNADVGSARTFAMVSTIGIAVGAVVLGAGIVLHLLDTGVTSAKTRSIRSFTF
ncbi:MAG: tetratricopeptide repeat protein [Labilithrix sp.]|nr:tetratricopeptide repeat protein [Labilithrix sp.]MCW5816933.1 tetratricopeptide repeat protein [Labilithrix sp.]